MLFHLLSTLHITFYHLYIFYPLLEKHYNIETLMHFVAFETKQQFRSSEQVTSACRPCDVRMTTNTTT